MPSSESDTVKNQKETSHMMATAWESENVLEIYKRERHVALSAAYSKLDAFCAQVSSHLDEEGKIISALTDALGGINNKGILGSRNLLHGVCAECGKKIRNKHKERIPVQPVLRDNDSLRDVDSDYLDGNNPGEKYFDRLFPAIERATRGSAVAEAKQSSGAEAANKENESTKGSKKEKSGGEITFEKKGIQKSCSGEEKKEKQVSERNGDNRMDYKNFLSSSSSSSSWNESTAIKNTDLNTLRIHFNKWQSHALFRREWRKKLKLRRLLFERDLVKQVVCKKDFRKVFSNEGAMVMAKTYQQRLVFFAFCWCCCFSNSSGWTFN
eukprot:Nk52_evm54s240 gene=Nk52_evmTU54s240